jgi:hypothetical protein
MTKGWQFTLAAAGTNYNLWDDLITKDSSFTDPTFSYAPYVPKVVCEINVQAVANPVKMTEDTNLETSDTIAADGSYRKGVTTNCINLQAIGFNPTVNGTVINVSITAR